MGKHKWDQTGDQAGYIELTCRKCGKSVVLRKQDLTDTPPRTGCPGR